MAWDDDTFALFLDLSMTESMDEGFCNILRVICSPELFLLSLREELSDTKFYTLDKYVHLKDPLSL